MGQIGSKLKKSSEFERLQLKLKYAASQDRIVELERSHVELERSHVELERSHAELERSHAELDRSYVELVGTHEKACQKWSEMKDALDLADRKYERLRETHADVCRRFEAAQEHITQTLSGISVLLE